MEQQINLDFATIKSEFGSIATVQPVSLSQNKYFKYGIDLENNNPQTHRFETGVVDCGNIVENLKLVYKKNIEQLEKLNLNPIQKQRLVGKIHEDCCFILLQYRYFKKIASIFSKPIDGKLIVPMVSDEDESGLIMTPEELNLLFGDLTKDYTSYLLALLRLVDVIVDYTSEVIIKISISQSDKLQYSLAVINSQLTSKLQQGFQLLDLKNDNLRRKYDGLKYQVKKINGMVYDLSLRKLILVDAEVV